MLIPILQNVCAVLGILLTVCFFYQIAYLFIPLILRKKRNSNGKQHRFAILIAARNEEAVIPHLLDSIMAQDYPAELVTTYVIADNCTDKTALVASQHGARVYERFNKKQVGKGYALDYLLDRIDADAGLDSYDAFLIFDADNLLLPNYLTEMNKTVGEGYAAFSGYRNSKNFGDSWVSAGQAMWYLHDSVHLNKSRYLLNVGCAVNGTGFGFTRELLREMGGWKFFTLTEDLEYSLWCATHGHKIGYCHDAILYDEQPTTFRQSWRQRTRWSQGGIQIAFRYTGTLFRGWFQGGWASWSSFETTTLSLWGVSLMFLSGIMTMILSILSAGVVNTLITLLIGVLTSYVSFAGIGLLTLLTEWKRIRATSMQKVMGVLSFPLYMITWLPISALAGLRKFQWTPIEHTVAVSADKFTGTKK